MSLGEKLRKARLQAGLSQRQLCGEEITRNMLSQIEHGTAQPSISTLQYISTQLGLPASYFLEEESSASPNGCCMSQAWTQFEKGDSALALQTLESYRSPDTVYDREYALLRCIALLALAENAMSSGKKAYARQLLSQVQTWEKKLTWLPDLNIRTRLFAAQLGDPLLPDDVPELDCLLMQRGRTALEAGDSVLAAKLLDAVEHPGNGEWYLLRGRAAMEQQNYSDAADLLTQAEPEYPAAAAMLEICYRELGNYRLAYEYACKCRKR